MNFCLNELDNIGFTLTKYLKICSCQRKLKSIVDSLVSIYEKCIGANEGTHTRDFTGAEWLLIAMLENYELIDHGISCAYPIVNQEHAFWKWILEIKDSPYLEDN